MQLDEDDDSDSDDEDGAPPAQQQQEGEGAPVSGADCNTQCICTVFPNEISL